MRAVLVLLASACVAPGCGDDASSPPDLAARCGSDRECAGATPRCQLPAGLCVACLDDNQCPPPLLCRAGSCARGCSASRGCGDAGSCDVDAGLCRACAGDADCGGDSPRCQRESGRCLPCLPPSPGGPPDSCPPGRACVESGDGFTCALGCKDDAECRAAGPPTAACCDHLCVDTASSKGNCGACGTICPFPSVCCNAACNDLQSDARSCGTCGRACDLPHASSSACRAGACAITACAAGFADCNAVAADGCEVDLLRDPRHCGGCGLACGLANAFAGCDGTCTVAMCKTGFADCDGAAQTGCEVDVTSNPAHCGGCGLACVLAHAAGGCVAGMCTVAACNGTFADCDRDARNGCEVDVATDTAHCGACGKACPQPAHGASACAIGQCVVGSCDAPFADCDRQPGNGCEVELSTSVAHCGGCGAACAPAHATPACVASVCTVAQCDARFADCNRDARDGCEVDTAGDPASCGGCGKACPAVANGKPGCAQGACGVGACDAGWGDCDGQAGTGCETDLSTSAAHCGGCGKGCAQLQICLNGRCVFRDYGTGADGPINLGFGQSMTLGAVRTPASGVAGRSTLTVGSAQSFAAGNAVMVHQSQGIGAGLYELGTVVATGNNQLTLASPLTYSYSSSGSDRAQVLRVPQYTDVTVGNGATLGAAPWDGTTGGILAFQATGTVTLSGIVSMDGRGYRGSTHACFYRCMPGFSGESPTGPGSGSANANGSGGGGGTQGQDCGMGGGGGYGSAGGAGQNGSVGSCSPNPHLGGAGGGVLGLADLSQSLLFGGAGGEGGGDEDGSRPGAGGNGGGVIYVAAFKLVVGGSISASGLVGGGGEVAGGCGGSGCGMGGGGGGAGGAIRFVSTNASLGVGLVTAVGAAGGSCTCGGYTAGAGGNGRVAVKAPAVTGSSSPAFFGG